MCNKLTNCFGDPSCGGAPSNVGPQTMTIVSKQLSKVNNTRKIKVISVQMLQMKFAISRIRKNLPAIAQGILLYI